MVQLGGPYRAGITSDLLVGVVHKLEGARLPGPLAACGRRALADGRRGKAEAEAIGGFWAQPEVPAGLATAVEPAQGGPDPLDGLWLNLNGYWEGISPQNQFSPEVRATLQPVNPTELMPAPEGDAALRLFCLSRPSAAGFDFLKIDDQAETIEHYHGAGNPVRAARLCQEAKETVSESASRGLSIAWLKTACACSIPG